MLLVAVALTFACLRAADGGGPAPTTPLSWSRGLDVVVAYEVSWILMFADYPRYTRSPAGSAVAVFVALAVTSMWIMPLGMVAARAAGSTDPGAMLQAVGLGRAGALLLTLATVTTNFVNIYMSALAWKSLVPRASDAAAVWSIGLIGTALGAAPAVWLDQYTNFMMLLGGILVPVGGVLIAHFYQRGVAVDDRMIQSLYDERGPYGGILVGGVVAWAAGAIAYFVPGDIGGTLPALVVSMVVYRLMTFRRSQRVGPV
jgi:nucleobase:cation symporter-1, NCS1 family